MKKFNTEKARIDFEMSECVSNIVKITKTSPKAIGYLVFSNWLAEEIECSHSLTHFGNSMEAEECIFCDCLINHHIEYCKNIEHKAPRINLYLEEVLAND